jgi:hypothetical protein
MSAAKYRNRKRASSKLIVGSFSGQYSPRIAFFQPAASKAIVSHQFLL